MSCVETGYDAVTLPIDTNQQPRRANPILPSLQGSLQIYVTGETISESYGKWACHIHIQIHGKGWQSVQDLQQYLLDLLVLSQRTDAQRGLASQLATALSVFHAAVSTLYGPSLQRLLRRNRTWESRTSFAIPSFLETV